MANVEEQPDITEDRKTAFVVENVAEDLEVLETLLRERDFEPVSTDDPDLALDQAREAAPSLIVLSADVNKAFNLCHRMKKDEGLAGIPLVLVTGTAKPDVIRKHRMLPTRADAYVDKPLDGDGLGQVLDELYAAPVELDVSPDDLSESVDDKPPPLESPPELPETSGLSEAVEVEVGELPDRTLVTGGLESAVVTYVEEEMGNLRDMVARLETEKGGLNAKVQALESQLDGEKKRLDSGLKVLLEKETKSSDPADDSSVQEALEEGKLRGRQEASAEVDILQSKLARYEEEAAAEAEANAALKAELAQTTILFERLEAGYKESLATAESRRESAEEALSSSEQKAESLREEVTSLKASVKDLPSLREMAARAELLEEDNGKLLADLEEQRAQAEALKVDEGRVTELEGALKESKATQADLESKVQELTKANEELTTINEDLQAAKDELQNQVDGETERLAAIEESKHSAEQTAEFARAEVSEMRDKFNKLKSIIGDSMESSGLSGADSQSDAHAIVEESIELVDDS